MTTKRNPVILNEVKDLYAALSCGIEGYFLSSASTQPTTFREEPLKMTYVNVRTLRLRRMMLPAKIAALPRAAPEC